MSQRTHALIDVAALADKIDQIGVDCALGWTQVVVSVKQQAIEALKQAAAMNPNAGYTKNGLRLCASCGKEPAVSCCADSELQIKCCNKECPAPQEGRSEATYAEAEKSWNAGYCYTPKKVDLAYTETLAALPGKIQRYRTALRRHYETTSDLTRRSAYHAALSMLESEVFAENKAWPETKIDAMDNCHENSPDVRHENAITWLATLLSDAWKHCHPEGSVPVYLFFCKVARSMITLCEQRGDHFPDPVGSDHTGLLARVNAAFDAVINEEHNTHRAAVNREGIREARNIMRKIIWPEPPKPDPVQEALRVFREHEDHDGGTNAMKAALAAYEKADVRRDHYVIEVETKEKMILRFIDMLGDTAERRKAVAARLRATADQMDPPTDNRT